MSSMREKMENEIAECMCNYEINGPRLINLIITYKTRFPNFKFNLQLTKKEQTEYCSGYCLQNKVKYLKDQLLKFDDSHPHKYCENCVVTWIRENFKTNPKKKIDCQRCVMVNKPGPTFEIPIICGVLGLNEQQYYEAQSSFESTINLTKCSSCQNPISANEKKNFLCMHEYCRNCLYQLTIAHLDYYYNMINAPDVPLENLQFSFPCHNYCQLSESNDVVRNLQETLASYNDYQGIQEYIQFVSLYPKFFSNKSPLFKCNFCRTAYEIESSSTTCKNCGKCKCGKSSHPGISCESMGSKVDKYIIDNNFMVPQPPEGDQSIVKIFAILTGKLGEILQVPRRIVKVWRVNNEIQDYYFSFAKSKKNIMTSLMTDTDYKDVIQNNFRPDLKNVYSFDMKINNMPEKKFILYLEIMYDVDLGAVDPDTVDESIKYSKMFLLNHAGKYVLNNIRSIRIEYIIELN